MRIYLFLNSCTEGRNIYLVRLKNYIIKEENKYGLSQANDLQLNFFLFFFLFYFCIKPTNFQFCAFLSGIMVRKFQCPLKLGIKTYLTCQYLFYRARFIRLNCLTCTKYTMCHITTVIRYRQARVPIWINYNDYLWASQLHELRETASRAYLNSSTDSTRNQFRKTRNMDTAMVVRCGVFMSVRLRPHHNQMETCLSTSCPIEQTSLVNSRNAQLVRQGRKYYQLYTYLRRACMSLLKIKVNKIPIM